MEAQLLSLENDISNYNKVKNLIVAKMIEEGYLSEEEGAEHAERCQVMVYKGTWFSRWFDKNVKVEKPNADKKGWYMRIVELKEKEDEVDKLLRRTTGDYDD